MIGWGAQFQVSGLGRQVPGSGVQARVQVQEIGHLSSAIDSAIFHFQVAGGSSGWPVAGLQPSVIRHRFSPPFSPQRSPPRSPPIGLCHLSSIQPSFQSSTQSSTQPSIQPTPTPTPTPSSPILPLPPPRPRPYALGG